MPVVDACMRCKQVVLKRMLLSLWFKSHISSGMVVARNPDYRAATISL